MCKAEHLGGALGALTLVYFERLDACRRGTFVMTFDTHRGVQVSVGFISGLTKQGAHVQAELLGRAVRALDQVKGIDVQVSTRMLEGYDSSIH